MRDSAHKVYLSIEKGCSCYTHFGIFSVSCICFCSAFVSNCLSLCAINQNPCMYQNHSMVLMVSTSQRFHCIYPMNIIYCCVRPSHPLTLTPLLVGISPYQGNCRLLWSLYLQLFTANTRLRWLVEESNL